MIEHEISQSKTGAHADQDIRYVESDVKDRVTHNQFIEKVFYFHQIDQVVLYEQNLRLIRIYEGKTMKWIKDLVCVAVILALEFCPNKNAIAASLTDRTIIFFDTANPNNKIVRKMNVPSTQKCLNYVESKSTLYSAGVDGAIFAWNLDKLFSNEFQEQQLALRQQMQQKQNEVNDEDRKRNRPKTSTNQADDQSIKKEYVLYITERTPWFVGDIILCITYLKNINQLASGSYDHKIRLWDLRESAKQLAH